LGNEPQTSNNKQNAFDIFMHDFVGYLASDEFSEYGSLSKYLKRPESDRCGDEANIVDMKITSILLFALGYAPKEWDYNTQKGNMRPDFSIKIPEYPRPACFIVEDKATTEIVLSRNRSQLQGYITQRGAPRGLLINGYAILAYDQLEGGLQTPAIEVPLARVVSAWRGEDIAAHGLLAMQAVEVAGLLARMSALWRRFRRDSFSGLQGLIDDLTLQSNKGAGAPHKVDGETWTPELSRIPILHIDSDNADSLTDAVKGLISEFEDDADAQLAAIEADYRDYEIEAERIPSDNSTLKVQEDGLIENAIQIFPKNLQKDLNDYEVSLLRKFIRNEVGRAELDQVERWLYEIHDVKAGKGTSNDSIFVLFSRIRAFSDKRHRYLVRIEEQHRDSIKVINHFRTWKEKTAALVFQSEDQSLLRREFLSQTAYLVIIRLLIVRIMEDKRLVNRLFTNGGIALWFREVEPHYLKHAMGRSASFLLDLAYTSAQHIYANFFAKATVFDWYSPDRNAIVRVLHKLAQFDLQEINRDIIGTVYNQYVEVKHKHESGMYFTPPAVVALMLDRIGYRGRK
jgi:type I restriction enzyme M protein